LEDGIEMLRGIEDGNTLMFEVFTKPEYNKVYKVYELCGIFREYYDRLEEKEET